MKVLLLAFFVCHLVAAKTTTKSDSPKWLTLSGDAPLVVARGGYSGLFPDSSQYAYQFAISTSLKEVVVLCDLQLTKDGTGICHSGVTLDNYTTIDSVYPKGAKTHNVNGKDVHGWFAMDFTADQLLSNVALVQSIFSRPGAFDGTMPLSLVEDITSLRPSQLWINVEYSMLYKQQKLDMSDFVTEASKVVLINYISSPEIDFLKSIKGKLKRAKLVFKIVADNAVEPSTKKTYGSLLEDLATIKSFATGILVPKTSIWPVDSSQYLKAHTGLVEEAHKAGLEVYAYNFANDIPGSYNYSYDPTKEYLQFVDNKEFSVDGVLTDFPSTASEAVACLAHNQDKPVPAKGRPLVITHNGASGVFPASTDAAYEKALQDGADVIDCSVQMSKDGVAFCFGSVDLSVDSDVMATFMSQSNMVPEIQKNSGIFSFDLTWSEVQTLKPVLANPLKDFDVPRNPVAKNQGKFMSLADFLQFAQQKGVSGIMLNVDNAAYLASKQGLDIVSAVTQALNNATYKNQVYVQSDDSAVLSKFSSYKRVLRIDDVISASPKPVVKEIPKYADIVNLIRYSLISANDGFLHSYTDVADEMHAANVSVWVSVLRNEFVAIPFDFFSDPIIEMATYVSLGASGLVTEYPATATSYLRSPCFDVNAKLPYSILPVDAGALLQLATPEMLPPVAAPAPALKESDVIDPPLPPVKEAEVLTPAPVPTSPPSSGAQYLPINVALCLVMVIVSFMYLMSYN